MLLSLVTDLLVRVEEATGQPLEVSGEPGEVVITIRGVDFDPAQGLLVPHIENGSNQAQAGGGE